jgi:hypothetical protein
LNIEPAQPLEKFARRPKIGPKDDLKHSRAHDSGKGKLRGS